MSPYSQFSNSPLEKHSCWLCVCTRPLSSHRGAEWMWGSHLLVNNVYASALSCSAGLSCPQHNWNSSRPANISARKGQTAYSVFQVSRASCCCPMCACPEDADRGPVNSLPYPNSILATHFLQTPGNIMQIYPCLRNSEDSSPKQTFQQSLGDVRMNQI